MKKLLLLTALALTCAATAAPRASAQSAQFHFTPLSSSTIAPGGTIQFSIHLVFTAGGNIQNVQGLTYFLQQNNPAPFFFSITGRDNEPTADPVNHSLFNDEISTNAQVTTSADNQGPAGPDNLLNAINDRDLGALADISLGSGTYFIANITLSIASNFTVGGYTIQSTTTGNQTSVITNSDGNTLAIQPGTISIAVIPEPSTYALLLVGAAGAGIMAHRRRRASVSA